MTPKVLFTFLFLVLTAAPTGAESLIDTFTPGIAQIALKKGEVIKPLCGAGAVEPRTYLTAAHCQSMIERLIKERPGWTAVIIDAADPTNVEPVSEWFIHPVKDLALLRVARDVATRTFLVAGTEEMASIRRHPSLYPLAIVHFDFAGANHLGVVPYRTDSFQIDKSSWLYKVNRSAAPEVEQVEFDRYIFLNNLINDRPIIRTGDSGLPLFAQIDGQWKIIAVVSGGTLATTWDALKAKFTNFIPNKTAYSRYEWLDLNFDQTTE